MFEDVPAANNHLQSSLVDVGSTNEVESHSGIIVDAPLPVGPKHFSSVGVATPTTSYPRARIFKETSPVMANRELSHPGNLNTDLGGVQERTLNIEALRLESLEQSSFVQPKFAVRITPFRLPSGMRTPIVIPSPPDASTLMEGSRSGDLADFSHTPANSFGESDIIGQPNGQVKLSPLFIEESIPPIAWNAVTSADIVPNPAGGPAHLPIEETTQFVADEPPNPSANEVERPFFVESTVPSTVAPAQDLEQRPHPHVVDTTADKPSLVFTPTRGTTQHAASLDQEQDELDAIAVDALLMAPADSDTTSTPEVFTTGGTETPDHGLTSHPSNLSADNPPPSTTPPSQQDPDDFQETPMRAPFRRPSGSDDTAMMQEPATHPRGSHSVLEGYPPWGNTTVPGLGWILRAFQFRTYT